MSRSYPPRPGPPPPAQQLTETVVLFARLTLLTLASGSHLVRSLVNLVIWGDRLDDSKPRGRHPDCCRSKRG
jgi:hypothetical protein